MANTKELKVHLQPDTFMKCLKKRGYPSLRSFAIRTQVFNERTLRRFLADCSVPITSAVMICETLDCRAEEAFGYDNSDTIMKLRTYFW